MASLDWLLGRRLASHEAEAEQIGPATGVGVLGLDALGSAAYGPEAALTLLLPLGVLGVSYALPLLGIIIAVLFIVYISYRQTISAYPNGGGSYTVARENLGPRAGLLAAAALVLDYILNVAVGISAGVGALVSMVPSLLPHTLLLCLAILALLTVVNLRGVRESGLAFLLPTYAFVVTLFGVLAIGIAKSLLSDGHPVPAAPLPLAPAPIATVSAWLLVRAFASGCTAMTGVEAVSNGVPIFKPPTVKNAERTLTAIIATLAILLAGIGYLARAYGIVATEPGAEGYQSVLSLVTAAVVGRGPFYYATLWSVATVLALSANTSFADFPRLCRILAEDRYLPDSFATRGRRLVFTQGILVLAVLSGALLVVFGGVTDRLIPLFAVGAFLAFTLSQAGMVGHWRRIGGPHARHALPLNLAGALATGATTVVVVVSKFAEGAWLTVAVIPTLLYGFVQIQRHYQRIGAQVCSDAPLCIEKANAPIVIVAAQSWNKLTERGIRFALQLSGEVHAVQIKSESAKMQDLTAQWERLVAEPARAAGLRAPQLIVLTSHYRQLFQPFLDYVLELRDRYPNRDLVVVIPDLVVDHWYQRFLHNNRGAILRALLRLRGGPRVAVVNTPFYLSGDAVTAR